MNEQLDRPTTAPAASTMSAAISVGPPPLPQRRRRASRRVLVAMVLFALVIGAGAAWWMSRAANAVSYTTAVADRGGITRTVTATGMVNPVLTVTVGSYVSGVIQKVLCDFNTKVRKDQVCARIDPRPFQSLVDQSKVNLDIAKAQLDKVKASSPTRSSTTSGISNSPKGRR